VPQDAKQIVKVLSNRTGLHHVRLVEELNTGVRHNPPLVAKDGNLCKSAISHEAVAMAGALFWAETRHCQVSPS
jgi:hypothetical protein